MTFDFVVPNEAERVRYGHIVSHGFGFPEADSVMWFERAGHDNLRILRKDGKFVGGLISVPMGQFFGGKSVKMVGVSGVGVAPHARGEGTGTRMMHAFEEDSKKRGFALSTLYGATHTLYERAGYFRGGVQCEIAADARMLQSMKLAPHGVTLEEVTELSTELHAVYNQVSRNRPGFLERGPYQWTRIISPRGKTTKTWVAREGGVATGYVVLATKAEGPIEISLTVLDMVATTRASAHAILKVLGSYASVVKDVKWMGSPADMFVSLLPERHVAIEVSWYWLTQLVDVSRAIAERGYSKFARGEVDVEISRERLGDTEKSAYRLTIENGAGALAPSTHAPTLAITERGMVALYTGLHTAKQLVCLGEIEPRGSSADDALEFLCAAFAGPTPAMGDHF